MEGECGGLLKTRREGRNKSVPRTVGVSARVSARVFVEWSSLACVCVCGHVYMCASVYAHSCTCAYFQRALLLSHLDFVPLALVCIYSQQFPTATTSHSPSEQVACVYSAHFPLMSASGCRITL